MPAILSAVAKIAVAIWRFMEAASLMISLRSRWEDARRRDAPVHRQRRTLNVDRQVLTGKPDSHGRHLHVGRRAACRVEFPRRVGGEQRAGWCRYGVRGAARH